jgi:hypothetical protein
MVNTYVVVLTINGVLNMQDYQQIMFMMIMIVCVLDV